MKMTIIPKALRVCACEAERGVCWEFVWCDKSEMMITVCAFDQDMSVCVFGGVGGGGWSVSARSWSVKEDCIVCVCVGGGGGAVKQNILVSPLSTLQQIIPTKQQKTFRVTFGNYLTQNMFFTNSRAFQIFIMLS